VVVGLELGVLQGLDVILDVEYFLLGVVI